MIQLDEEMQKRIGKMCADCGEIIRAFAEDAADVMDKLTEVFRRAFGIVVDLIDDLIPELVEALNDQNKTKPPRHQVKMIGRRPQTTIPHRRIYRTQRRG